MGLRCGMENEAFKYKYGRGVKWKLPFEEDKKLSINCARNDWAAAQLVLYSEEEMMVNVAACPCFYEKWPLDVYRVVVDAADMPEAKLLVNLVGLVQDDDGQYKSEVLLKQPYIHVEPRKAQPVWVEVKTGKDTPPGTYTISLSVYRTRIFGDEELASEQSFDIIVYDTLLPDLKDSNFYLDLWQHLTSIARTYETKLWGDRHFEILEKYAASLADLGQKAITVIVSEIPWTGQWSSYHRTNSSDTFEYSMVKVSRDEDGKFVCDFSALNRYICICMKYGINSEIEVFGLIGIWQLRDVGYGNPLTDYSDGIRIRYFDEKFKTYKYMKTLEEAADYIRQLERNFTENGWTDIVRIICDEPHDKKLFESWIETLKDIAPSFIFKATVNKIDFIREKSDQIRDFSPSIINMSKDYESFREIKKNISGRIYFYDCCSPDYPVATIKSPLLENRVFMWLAWNFGMNGFLRWNYCLYPNNPFDFNSYHHQVFPAGDTHYVYPGKDGEPLLSLRYMHTKRGIRDFVIFEKFAEKFGREKIDKAISKVLYYEKPADLHPDSRKKREELYSLDYNDYEEVVSGLLKELSKT